GRREERGGQRSGRRGAPTGESSRRARIAIPRKRYGYGLETGCGPGVARVRARLHDVGELRDRVPELVLGVVEVRAEPDARVGSEVADDPPLAELAVHGRVVGRAHEHGAAAALRVAGTAELEAGGVEQFDQQLRERERARPDPLYAGLLDYVVARGRRVERRHVRCPGEEAARALGVLQLRLERK